MKQTLQTHVLASTLIHTMVYLCMWMCTCAVLLIFASCVWQSPWPLTTMMEPTWVSDCRTGSLEVSKSWDDLGWLHSLRQHSTMTDYQQPSCQAILLDHKKSHKMKARLCRMESGGGVKVYLLLNYPPIVRTQVWVKDCIHSLTITAMWC